MDTNKNLLIWRETEAYTWINEGLFDRVYRCLMELKSLEYQVGDLNKS